ncbi:hypothetical protein SAMN05443633_101128 [Chryseobacterium arachidis]|uniref:LysM domain-containing protein n=2 Tax=Chryseobacterium arachidis TaxID=1416778 RepID=A0A1M4T195_9FLAO|nr:hypothetical protein [Chryseobacterium arachidis]SHE38248.1 hypothetical protein SAMN05443633_101128 [Chryseobacterium arachidis]
MMVHFILFGETLESISEEIHLENPKYLKEFHNRHCAKGDLIDHQLVPGKKLFIPDTDTVKRYNSRNDAPFKHPKLNPEIPFNPENFSRIYSVKNIEREENESSRKSNQLTYTVSVKWIRIEENTHVFHLFKNNFSEENSSKMAYLASESIKALNPIEVTTDGKGEVIKVGLTEHTIKNFHAIKERLFDFFPDQYAKIYLDEFEFAVLNEDVFDARMKEDIFIKNYFPALRNGFINGTSHLRQSIGENNNKVDLQQKVKNSDYKEEITLLQQLNSDDSNKNFNGSYTLYWSSGMVKSIEIQSSISQFGVKYSNLFLVEELA